MKHAAPRTAITMLTVIALVALAAPNAGASSARVHLLDDEPAPELLIPLIEIPIYNVTLSLVNRAVFQGEWTQVTLQTIGRNIQGGWVFDKDDFDINNVGHPYQGAQPFLSARSAGYGFWPASLAALISSLWWEIAGEAEPPSINDQLTSTIGGSFLGEALHRASLTIFQSEGVLPAWFRWTARTLLDPSGAFNAWLTGGKYDRMDGTNVPILGRLSLGLNVLGRITTDNIPGPTTLSLGEELHVSVGLRSGFPVHPGIPPQRPFDHFDVQAELSVSRQPFVTLFVGGLLFGRLLELGVSTHAIVGLFGRYDFANPPSLRVSTVASGPGAAITVDVSRQLQLQGTMDATFVAWGSAGALPRVDGTHRDYHTGPGLQVVADLTLVHRRAGSIRVSAREYLITGAYSEPGIESITYVTFGGATALSRQFELRLDAIISARNTQYPGDMPNVHQRSSQMRVGLTWLTDVDHGATHHFRP